MKEKNISGLNVQIFDNPDELGDKAANRLINKFQNGFDTIGAPTGRSPKPIYDNLETKISKLQPDLSNLDLFWMDEYVFENNDGYEFPDRNAEYTCRNYVDELVQNWNSHLPDEKQIEEVHFPQPNKPSNYERLIKSTGGIDCFITAAGTTDGHVALNPANTSIDSRTRVINLSEQTRRDNLRTFSAFNNDLTNVPTHGVSVGLSTILDSDEIIFVAHSEEKQNMIERVLQERTFDPEFPATFLWEAKEKTTIMIDQAAYPDSISHL